MKYDSEAETRKHIKQVGDYLLGVIQRLTFCIMCHDKSKLSKEEKYIFDKFTPKLAKCTYGSDKYKEFLNEMKPALDHHYDNNKHHPEHHWRKHHADFTGKVGLNDMNLIEIIEMLCDWKAATLRHDDGDIYKSIELNQKRFYYSDEIKDILINTAKYMDF